MKTSTPYRYGFAVLIVSVSLAILSCSQPRGDRPTPEAAKRFLKLRGYEFNGKSFHAAIVAHDLTAVNGFLAAGIDPNVKDEIGVTVLISAAATDDLSIVEALLRGGADVNVRANSGYNAILRAIQDKHYGIADLLLTQPQLELNAQSPRGTTVLMSYVRREQESVVKSLLERGADPKLSDADGDTALHSAAQKGNVKIASLLLDAGADPNAKNKLGGTALMWAGVYGHEEVARVLLDKGASPSLKDNDGLTAADWAIRNQKEAVVRLLREAEKKRQ